VKTGRDTPNERRQYGPIPYDVIDQQLSPDALAAYNVIVRHAYGNVAVLSLARIGRSVGMKRDWARRPVRELVEAGCIEPIEVPHGFVPKYRLTHSVHARPHSQPSIPHSRGAMPPHSQGATQPKRGYSFTTDAHQKNGKEETTTTPCASCGARLLVTQRPGETDKIEPCNCDPASKAAYADFLAGIAAKRNGNAKAEAANVV